MPPLAEDYPTRTTPGSFAMLSTGEFVASITKSMKAIAQLYANALNDARFDADMLVALLYLGSGATREELEPEFGFAVDDAGKVLDRLISGGFISLEADDMLRPTKEAQAIFLQLSRLAQKENLRWREQLQNMPGGRLLLDDFLTMLQSSHNT